MLIMRIYLFAAIFLEDLRAILGEWQPLECPLTWQGEKSGRKLLAIPGTIRRTGIHLAAVDQSQSSAGLDVAVRPDGAIWNTSVAVEQLRAHRKPRGRKKANRKKPSEKSQELSHTIDRTNPPWKQKGYRDAHAHNVHTRWLSYNAELISVLFWFMMCMSTMCALCFLERKKRRDMASSRSLSRQDSSSSEPIRCPFDEDTYGMAIGLLIKDAHTLSVSYTSTQDGLLWSRLFYSMGLLYFTISLQIFLLLQIKKYITPAAVDAIRLVYSEYEWRMYGSNMSNGHLVAPDLYVGNPKFFDREAFEYLRFDLKKEVCHIPFSQPLFFVSIIFLWAFTCASEMRKTWDVFEQIGIMMPALSAVNIEDIEPDASLPPQSVRMNQPEDGSPQQILALSRWLKAFVAVFILLPRIFIASFLLWIGCRWLAATNDFGDLIMNALALEFILLLKDLVYFGIASRKTKRDLSDIVAQIPAYEETLHSMCMAFLFGVLAIIWSIAYVFAIQQVIPAYNWDVNDVCKKWIREKAESV